MVHRNLIDGLGPLQPGEMPQGIANMGLTSECSEAHSLRRLENGGSLQSALGAEGADCKRYLFSIGVPAQRAFPVTQEESASSREVSGGSQDKTKNAPRGRPHP